MKKVYEPVDVRAEGAAAGRFELVNKHDFRSTDGYEIGWRVEADGDVIAAGAQPAPAVEAGETAPFAIRYGAFDAPAGAEVFVVLEVRQPQAGTLTPAGWVVGHDQFGLPTAPADPAPAEPRAPLVWDEDTDGLTVVGEDFQVRFGAASGTIDTWTYRGVDLVARGPLPSYWRAPTDNDLGNKMPDRLAAWETATQTQEVLSVAGEELAGGAVRVVVERGLPAVGGEATITYTVRPDATVHVEHALAPGADAPDEVPRVGLDLALPPAFDRMTWVGRGPHESYRDRKTSALVGRYTLPVADAVEPYVRPQETGNRTDVRWLAVHDGYGAGLLAVADSLLEASAWPFGYDVLALDRTRARHGAEVTVAAAAHPVTTMRLDWGQFGVGGDNSWGFPVNEPYLIATRPMRYGFTLRPYTTADGDPGALARTLRATGPPG